MSDIVERLRRLYVSNGTNYVQEAADEIEKLRAERDGLMQTLRDEMDENLRLRELGGAQPDENITAMTERLIRERDDLRAEVERLRSRTVTLLPLPEHVATIGTDGHPRHIRHVWGVMEKRNYGPPVALFTADQIKARDEQIVAALRAAGVGVA